MITYLAGGINGLSDVECKAWRELAKTLLTTQTLDPMDRDYRGVEDANVNQIVIADLEDIRNADYVLVNATRGASWGTAMELVYAREWRKVTIAFVGGAKVSPWLRYHSYLCVRSIEEGVKAINALALETGRRTI